MVEDFILPVFNGGKFYTACFLLVENFIRPVFLWWKIFILSKIFCPKFSCIKSSMPDIQKISNHQKLVCIKFYVKNFPVSRSKPQISEILQSVSSGHTIAMLKMACAPHIHAQNYLLCSHLIQWFSSMVLLCFAAGAGQ